MIDYTIGIDLGTTNSCVAVYRNNQVEILVNEHGDRVTPSWVTFTNDLVYTGKQAIDEFHQYSKTTVFEAKRLIGQKFNDPQVQEDIKRFPYEVFDDLGQPKIKIKLDNGTESEYYPEEISAFILRKMRTIAEHKLKATITRAVVTVPAYFNDSQRQATKDAAAIAGFKIVNVINEPTAAALAFSHHFRKAYKRNIVVYDFGGGTFDVSVVSIRGGKCEVKATKGDSHLGGIDIDNILINMFKDNFRKKYNTEIEDNDITGRRLNTKCEKAKKRLSTSFETKIELDELYSKGEKLSTAEHHNFNILRARFEIANESLFQKTLKIVKDCLEESGLKISDIDEVVLVGGSSRIPKVQTLLGDYFGTDKINKGVNPDEAVAYGAAIHATNLAGDKNEVTDVTSLSLGTNTFGDQMSFIIPRNTPIPAKSVKRYQTIMDNQTSMEFPIYQGEKTVASENFELGNFTMTNLTERPAKSVKVEICFQIDSEGLLKVTAVEIDSFNNNKKDIVIDVKKKGLTETQIEQRILEAEINRDKEIKRGTFKTKQYELQTKLYELEGLAEKRSADDANDILNKHDEILKWLETAKIDDTDKIIDKINEVQKLIKNYSIQKK